MSEEGTKPETGSPRTLFESGKLMGAFIPREPVEEEGKEEEVELATDEELEAESSDADEVDEDISEDEDAEPDEEEVSEAAYMTLTVNGEQMDVATEQEAKDLAQKGMHYTQEMQRLRKEQQEWGQEKEAITAQMRQKEGEYGAAVQSLAEVYGAVLGNDRPDWHSPEMQQLRTSNSDEYADLRAQWDQLDAIQAEQGRIATERSQQAKEAMEAHAVDELNKLTDKRPHWRDEARKAETWALMVKYAEGLGATSQDILSLNNHLLWMAIEDASRFAQAESTGQQAKPSIKTAAPGTGKKVNRGSRRAKEKRERLRATGNVRDAGALFQDIMTKK